MPSGLGKIGNFPTEDLVIFLEEMGVRTGLDPAGVLDCAHDVAAMLDERVDVSHDLTRVIFVREPVDYRNARMLCELFDDRLLEGTDHDDIAHARSFIGPGS